jgi:hypothetical protein
MEPVRSILDRDFRCFALLRAAQGPCKPRSNRYQTLAQHSKLKRAVGFSGVGTIGCAAHGGRCVVARLARERVVRTPAAAGRMPSPDCSRLCQSSQAAPMAPSTELLLWRGFSTGPLAQCSTVA